MKIFGYTIIQAELYESVWERMKEAVSRADDHAVKIVQLRQDLLEANRQIWFHSGEGYTAADDTSPNLDHKEVIRWSELKEGGQHQRYELSASVYLMDYPKNYQEMFEHGYVNWRGLKWKVAGMSAELDTFESGSFRDDPRLPPTLHPGMRTVQLTIEAFADRDASRYKREPVGG